jgi:uncharacterized protein YciI
VYFVVVSQQGPSWDPAKPMREQQLWLEHVEFVNGLMGEGFFLLGGPLAGSDLDEAFSPAAEPVGSDGLYRTMVVVEAADRAEAVHRVEQDPWVRGGVIKRASIDRWELLSGELSPAPSE